MKIRRDCRLVLLVVLVTWPPQLLAGDILYQPEIDSPIGTRNPAAPAESEQLDFLIGDWNVVVTLYQGEGEPLVYEAKWHNHWVADGYVVMQEWRGPYVTGIELRTFDPEAGHWHGRNIYYPRPATWYENTARFEDSQLIVTTPRTDAAGVEFISREIYRDITATSFRIVTERSSDGGKSWGRGRYELIATR